MNEWIKDFNVIYNDELYRNCVCLENHYHFFEDNKATIEDILIIYIDENGSLNTIFDKKQKFKFVRK